MIRLKTSDLLCVIAILLGIVWPLSINPAMAQDGCISHPLHPQVLDMLVAAANATLNNRNESNSLSCKENTDGSQSEERTTLKLLSLLLQKMESQYTQDISKLNQELQSLQQEVQAFREQRQREEVENSETERQADSLLEFLQAIKLELQTLGEKVDNLVLFHHTQEDKISAQNMTLQEKILQEQMILKEKIFSEVIPDLAQKTAMLQQITESQTDMKNRIESLKEQVENSNKRPTRDCWELHQRGVNESGSYSIFPGCDAELRVWCDMDTDDSAWTVVLLRRPLENQINFNRSWEEYSYGFGDPETEYWIGNEVLNLMTSHQPQILRVEMEDWDGNQRFAEYKTFVVENSTTKYRLRVGEYRGDAGDALKEHNNMYFSTPDRDNDSRNGRSCAAEYSSGFWYNNCSTARPTNPLLRKEKNRFGINWDTWHRDFTTIKKMVWKLKRASPCSKL